MLLAVFSDSHGNAGPMLRAIALHRPDRVLFLGDGVRDAELAQQRFPGIEFTILRGNCDPSRSGEDSALLRLEGVGIFAAHGHNHGVKYGLDRFCNSVWCSGSALGLYGHTHDPRWEEIRGMQILNPGSIGSALRPTFALVRLKDGRADCRILDAPADSETEGEIHP